MLIVDDILLLPWRGLMGILKEIHKYIEREMGDSERLREKLLEAQTLFEMDQIPEEEYLKREKELMARLDELEEDVYSHTSDVEASSELSLTSGKERKLKIDQKSKKKR